MKLSKVTKVLKEFNIEDHSNYRIDKLDPNRCPCTKSYKNGNVEHRTQVTLLFPGQEMRRIGPSVNVKNAIKLHGDDLLAVHVEFHRLVDDKTEKYEQCLFIN